MQRGFGLVSLLISLLIVSALTGVILLGYFQPTTAPLTRDLTGEGVRPDQGERLVEAQALLTRTLVALTLCAQAKGMAGRSCSFDEVARNAGVGGSANGLSVSLFATAGGNIIRCDGSGGPPPSSPASGQGC